MLDFLLKHTPLLYLTQSLWRDEAFSILAAERPVSFFIRNMGFEPPLYYLLLKVWMKLFGQGEIVARSLSLLGFTLATIIVIRWAEKLFKKHWLSIFLPLFFFLNPMLLYYAFEVRTYGWYTFFATAAMYAYLTKQWRWYVASAVAGFYTHTYMLFFIAAHGLHWLLTTITENGKRKKKKLIQAIIRSSEFRSFTAIFLLISPWLIKVVQEAGRLKESWYFPVNWQLVKSVLGNMFLGYEGTPWWGWRYTAWLSLILVALFLIALRGKAARSRNLFFFITTLFPLATVVGISFFKPIFVNRYLIPATVGEVFLIAFAIEAIPPEVGRKLTARKLTAIFFFLFTIFFNVWYPSQHPKLPIRETIREINALQDSNDVILATSSLIFFETLYYSTDRSRVFFYTPTGRPFPWYVGDVLVSQQQIVNELPPYPIRAFLINEDGGFEVAYQLQPTATRPKR